MMKFSNNLSFQKFNIMKNNKNLYRLNNKILFLIFNIKNHNRIQNNYNNNLHYFQQKKLKFKNNLSFKIFNYNNKLQILKIFKMKFRMLSNNNKRKVS